MMKHVFFELDPAATAAENAAAVDCTLFLAAGCNEPTGDDYRVAMALLRATSSELAVRASAADEAGQGTTHCATIRAHRPAQ